MNTPPAPPPPKSSVLAYIACAMIMSLIGVVAILLITILRPDKDNSQLFATIASLLVPTTGVIIALIKISEVHVMMNSRLDQLVASEKLVSKAAGVEEGRLSVKKIPVPLPVQIQQPATDPVPVGLKDKESKP